jgi:5-methylcytosine-specific restriction enzyme A
VTIYFQHVGEAGGGRDFPKTIGTPKAGLRYFSFKDINEHVDRLDPEQHAFIQRTLANEAPQGFQIWGIPSGAKSILKNLKAGDYLLLIESIGPS